MTTSIPLKSIIDKSYRTILQNLIPLQNLSLFCHESLLSSVLHVVVACACQLLSGPTATKEAHGPDPIHSLHYPSTTTLQNGVGRPDRTHTCATPPAHLKTQASLGVPCTPFTHWHFLHKVVLSLHNVALPVLTKNCPSAQKKRKTEATVDFVRFPSCPAPPGPPCGA